jgi:diguanylate cyclase (GGDEF)-like protein
MRRMSVVGIALPDRLFGVLVAGFHDPQGAERSARFVARMAGVARQAATVLRSRELLDETWQLAHVDPLTGLANRRAFMAELSGAVDAGPGALVFLDLDGFKQVNDTHGHGAGDELLSVVAARLATCVRGGDTVARLGGDEFVVLVRGLTDHRAVDELTARLRDALAQPIGLSMARVTARASVGVTLFDRGEPAEAVLHRADAAMYARKRQRRTLSPTAA